MTLKNSLILIFAVTIFTSCKNTKTNPITEILNTESDSLLSHLELNAISIGINMNGETFTMHKGELKKGAKNKPSSETLYEIASITKTFTGTLLAQAIVDKKVKLDDDIRIVLSDSFSNLEYDKNPITFRDLVTHRSGIPNMFPNKPEIFENPDYITLPKIINELQQGFSKQDFFEELHKVKLDTLPGTRFGYSNAGANLLGYCLESIYNKPYEEILKEYILNPLKMTHTKIMISDDELLNLAQGYNETGIKMPFGIDKAMSAEGGLKSTLEDMMKYVAFHLDENNPVIKTAHQELLGLWDDFENGLFWQMFKTKDEPRKIFQNGGAFGSSSWITIIPEKQIGVFIITNQSGPKTHGRLNAAVERIIEKLQKDL